MRSRERILEIARTHDPRALRLNDIAREAGVGIGTVYRHFPTARALVEALSVDSLARLEAAAEASIADADPASALRRFVCDAVALQLEDGGLEAVLTDLEQTDAAMHTECTAARAKVFDGYAAVLGRAQRADVARADLTPAQLRRLVCGIEHAVRLGSPDDRELLIDILLAGIRPAAVAAH
ncbi:TetR/AcrR family transcriptional regulator [Microbacterium aoyamense]|uniref:TetR/AcrR family transcriptional regulator n=1 Tax=Microbacterium aoyamense TaxID=344166 RepID=A0ABP5ASJ6_9MICO